MKAPGFLLCAGRLSASTVANRFASNNLNSVIASPWGERFRQSTAPTGRAEGYSLRGAGGAVVKIDRRRVSRLADRETLPSLCNLVGANGMILMPLTLDLRFWRWQITLKVRRRPQS
jgi:hypothetical protein